MRALKLKLFVEVIRKKNISLLSDHIWTFVSSARKKIRK